MSDEGSGRRSAGFLLKDGGFDFEIVLRVEVGSDGGDDSCSVKELRSALFAGDQVEVSVAQTGFGVLKTREYVAVFFFSEREGVEGFA